MKKIIVISMILGLFLWTHSLLAESAKPVDVGNRICPVSGAKISAPSEGGMEPATYVYEGKLYHFCCAGCIGAFKKDPSKYVAKINEEVNN